MFYSGGAKKLLRAESSVNFDPAGKKPAVYPSRVGSSANRWMLFCSAVLLPIHKARQKEAMMVQNPRAGEAAGRLAPKPSQPLLRFLPSKCSLCFGKSREYCCCCCCYILVITTWLYIITLIYKRGTGGGGQKL